MDNNSIVDFLKGHRQPSDMNSRKKLFAELGGSGTYTGTAQQNDFLRNKFAHPSMGQNRTVTCVTKSSNLVCHVGSFEPRGTQTAHSQHLESIKGNSRGAVGGSINSKGVIGYNSGTLNPNSLGTRSAQGTSSGDTMRKQLNQGKAKK